MLNIYCSTTRYVAGERVFPACFCEEEVPLRAPRSDYTFSITGPRAHAESAIDSCPRRSGSLDAQRNTSPELWRYSNRLLHPTRGKCTWISTRIHPLDLFRSPRGNRKRRCPIFAPYKCAGKLARARVCARTCRSFGAKLRLEAV